MTRPCRRSSFDSLRSPSISPPGGRAPPVPRSSATYVVHESAALQVNRAACQNSAPLLQSDATGTADAACASLPAQQSAQPAPSQEGDDVLRAHSAPMGTAAGQPVAEDRSSPGMDDQRLSNSFSMHRDMRSVRPRMHAAVGLQYDVWQQPHGCTIVQASNAASPLHQAAKLDHAHSSHHSAMASSHSMHMSSTRRAGADGAAAVLTDTSAQCLPPEHSAALLAQHVHRRDTIAAVRSELQGLHDQQQFRACNATFVVQEPPGHHAAAARHACEPEIQTPDTQRQQWHLHATDAHSSNVGAGAQEPGPSPSDPEPDGPQPASQGSDGKVANPTHSTLLREFQRLEELMDKL